MKFNHNLLNFYISIFFFINIINNHYNNKSINLRKSIEEQNVIEIEMKENLTGNIKFINLNNDKIEMYINENQSNFNNIIQFEENKNYKIKLIFPNDFNGSCEFMFKEIKEIKIIKFQNFNLCNNMSEMFFRCSSLESIDLSSFNTNNVDNMYLTFSSCSSLKTLDLSSFNTSNVYDMSHMFSGCTSLKSLNLSSFNTSNVIYMNWMFEYCTSLESIGLSSFNINNVKDMNHMFYECSSLKSLNLSSFNTSNVINMIICFKNVHH